MTNSNQWTSTIGLSGVPWYWHPDFPDILISHDEKNDQYVVIDQNGNNHGRHDDLDQAAGVAEKLL